MAKARPQRLQVSRKAGFNLQEASRELNGLPAKLVTRLAEQWLRGTLDTRLSPGPAPSRETIRAELAGHNLACWCKPGTPCHADVLIDLANGK
jgi:hypothetical protein